MCDVRCVGLRLWRGTLGVRSVVLRVVWGKRWRGADVSAGGVV